jgi:hypothetical protein
VRSRAVATSSAALAHAHGGESAVAVLATLDRAQAKFGELERQPKEAEQAAALRAHVESQLGE